MLAVGPSRAGADPLATVLRADRAYIGAATASAGSTVYDGDRLSTGMGGVLRLAAPAVTLQLDAQSAVIVRHASGLDILNTELTCGTVVFSARTGNIVVTAGDAYFRPASSTATVAHIRVVNRRELRVSAERGALEFSYHGQNALIPEGQAFRILLDPSEHEAASASPTGPGATAPGKRNPAFLLIAIAVAVAITVPLLIHALESPDKP